MSTFFVNEGFSSCEVGGFIASALIHDLRVNNFTFTNFPEVDVKWDDDNFYITLKTEGCSSPTFKLDYKTVKREVKRFRNKQEIGDEAFNIIQSNVAALEGAARDS